MKLRHIIISVCVVAAAMALFGLMQTMRPKPPQVQPVAVITSVEAMTVNLQDHEVRIETQGSIQPLTETHAAAEVGGKIISVAPNFHVGGHFQPGDTLLEIDPADYAAALAQSQSSLAEARLLLETEKARADQAKRDWQRLAPAEKANPLALRQPHLASIEARVRAAEAAVDRAQRDLERTHLRPPYQGLIKTKRADLGDYVIPGTPLADLWRSDIFEIRLPVSLEQFSHIEISKQPEAVLTAATQGTGMQWKAKIVRTEGLVEASTRSVPLVARLEAPSPAPMPGLFVRATVLGRTLENIAAVPRKALQGPARLVMVDSDNRLRFREVKIAWSDQAQIYVSEGLKAGELVCLTALAAVVEGMPVEVISHPQKTASVTAAERKP
ncbi:MAG: efflux RND transporter periplasmic adaptor subunit [Verrucomicrobiales bacterium]